MRVLITGVAGFAGSHLAEMLVESGLEVTGVSYPGFPLTKIKKLLDRIDIFQADINSFEEMQEVFRISRPDQIYHLAAVSSVRESWSDRRKTLETNVFGTLNILEAARLRENQPRVLLVGSAEVYGAVPEEDQPILETYPPLPCSPYAASKAAQELLGYQYAKAEGLHTVMVRAFNHTGPGQDEAFVCSSFARQVAEAEKGQRSPVIEVGNLDARRDFCDVRDVAEAYQVALESGEPGSIYNICSGKVLSIKEILDMLIGMSTVEMTVTPSETRMRPLDIPLLHGSLQRFNDETGWEPQIPMEQTLKDLLDHWRERA